MEELLEGHKGVTSPQPNRRSGRGVVSRFFALSILLLSFTVVFWGLHDKVSLYRNTGAAPPVAKAQLLSDKEQGQQAASVGLPVPPAPQARLTALFFASLLALSPARQPFPAEPETGPPGYRRIPHALRRRPPPVLHFALV